MRFARISVVVGVAVVSTVGAHAGCVAVDSLLTVNCVSHEVATESLPIPNDDAALDFKIQRCRLDADACTDLCTLVLSRTQPGFTSTACHATFTATSVTIHVGFDRPTGAQGCQNGGPIGVDDTVGSGMGGGFADAGVFPPPPDSDPTDAAVIPL